MSLNIKSWSWSEVHHKLKEYYVSNIDQSGICVDVSGIYLICDTYICTSDILMGLEGYLQVYFKEN